MFAAAPVDLAGTWKVRLKSCLAGELECQRQLTTLPSRDVDIRLPANLHEKYPWFYGEADFSRTFEYWPDSEKNMADVLLLGSIGSIDETYLNGVYVQRQGILTTSTVISAWNKVRAYSLPSGLLRKGQNEILTRVTVLDFKAGIHAGPLEVGHASDLAARVIGYQILREHLFLGSPLLTIVMIVVMLITARYWKPGEGNAYLIVASAGYLIHSLYFLPLPFPGSYLLLLKLQWTGRVISIIFTTTYFLSNFAIRDRKYHVGWFVAGTVLILIAWLPASYTWFFATMHWQQWAFLAHLVFPFLFWRAVRRGPRRDVYMQYVFVAFAVAALYINDALVLAYAISSAWLYNYMSLVNVINFFSHYSFHLYLWREEGQAEGKRDAELLHVQEKLKMAAELHDAVGADLAQLVVASEKMPASDASTLQKIASTSLEKVRNFAHLLKGETEPQELTTILCRLLTRLKALQRFDVVYLENPANTSLKRTGRGSNIARPVSTLLPASTAHHLHRVLSEWTSNIFRHARGVRSLTVGWQAKRGSIRVFVVQDSVRFRWVGDSDSGGLKSLTERALAMGGRIHSRPHGKGTLLLLSFPYTYE